MSWVSQEQLVEAIRQLGEFRDKVNKQRAVHILPFLALREKGVGVDAFTLYSETDDKLFWDKYLRVREGEYPYFDPFACSYRIKSHPHSNVATARKQTFWNSWHAGELDVSDGEAWKLNSHYVSILETKVLSKAGRTVRIPATAVAAFLLREVSARDTSELLNTFRKRFGLDDTEYSRLFDDTPLEAPFARAPLTPSGVVEAITRSGVVATERESRTDFTELVISADDKKVSLALTLLRDDGYAGVILVGPPGTSKSWYAQQIALHLTDGDPSRVFKVQFHPSYQYENFVEGFAPTREGGFELKKQIVRRVAELAEREPDSTFVIVIDELSRSDPARVFGELLTYMERSRRGERFWLSSGDDFSLPDNIVFVATMNSLDKTVVEIDDAFERRMGKISLAPDPDLLVQLLTENKVERSLALRIAAFLTWVVEKYPLGHTFFLNVRDEESLRRLWLTQLRFILEKRFRYEPNVLNEIRQKFIEITGIEVE